MPNQDAAENEKFMSSVKVGPKGQIVIPKEVREMFGIEPGAVLLLLADAGRGISIQRMEVFEKLTQDIFTGTALSGKTPQEQERDLAFASELDKIRQQNRKNWNKCDENDEL